MGLAPGDSWIQFTGEMVKMKNTKTIASGMPPNPHGEKRAPWAGSISCGGDRNKELSRFFQIQSWQGII
jgi:hypothetical protein